MDATDRRIVGLLEENARLTYGDIGKQVGLAASSVHDRVRKLEKAGTVKGYTAAIDLPAGPLRERLEDVGRPKAQSAADFVQRLNPEIKADVHATRLTDGNAAMIADYDLVADEMEIAEIRVDQGPTLKRWRARARGRGTGAGAPARARGRSASRARGARARRRAGSRPRR